MTKSNDRMSDFVNGHASRPYNKAGVILIFKALAFLARVDEGSHYKFYLPPHEWNEPSCLYFPAAKHHRTLAGTHFRYLPEAELAWVGSYTQRCYTHPKSVAHDDPSQY